MACRTTIEWISHAELSAAHAAYSVATEATCNDQKTEKLLVQPVTEVNNRLFASAVDVGQFWQQREISKASIAVMESLDVECVGQVQPPLEGHCAP